MIEPRGGNEEPVRLPDNMSTGDLTRSVQSDADDEGGAAPSVCANCSKDCRGGASRNPSIVTKSTQSVLTRFDDSSASTNACVACHKDGGGSYSAFSPAFQCEYCDRNLCGECVANVPCAGRNCTLSNCMECAESGVGDVAYCAHCGRGFCTDCKSMEYCFCVAGDTCCECHAEMHEYDVECYWRHVPPEVRLMVEECEGEIDGEGLAEFWRGCLPSFPPNEEFDLRLYRKTRRARAATLILASYHLLKGKDTEAVYLILFAALLEEVWNRGMDYITEVFEEDGDAPPTPQKLAMHFTSFHSVVENTSKRSTIVALLHNQLPSIREKEGKKLYECIDFALGKMPKASAPIHSLTVVPSEETRAALKDEFGGDSLRMKIITSNPDNQMKQNNFAYKDTAFGFWLNAYVIKCSYHQWSGSPVTPFTKYFRVVHKDTTLSLGADGMKTLHELGIEDGDEIVIEGVGTCEECSMHSESVRTFDAPTSCSVCKKKPSRRDSMSFDVCQGCGKAACYDCSSPFFDCDCCERLLCGDCVANVPCEGSGCGLANCMECTENGDGDVLYCTNCGQGFCVDCRSMEFCFCLVGDTCPECHSDMHDYDVEYYWQYLPSEMQSLVDDFAAEISKEKLVEFWQECLEFLPLDKDFDFHRYRKARQTRAAALILASDHLLKGWDNEAVYLILYASLLEEVWKRGSNYIQRIFDQGTGDITAVLATYFHLFRSVLDNTSTRAKVVVHLHNQLSSVADKEGKELFKCMDFALGKVQKSNALIFAAPSLSTYEYIRAMQGWDFGDSLDMKVTTYNSDSDQREEIEVYKDMSLGWLLKMYVIQSSYQNWTLNPEIPPSTKSTKYFRVVHQGKTLFLSSAGKKSLWDLGVRDGDKIVVSEMEPEDHSVDQTKPAARRDSTKGKKSKKKKRGSGSKKKKKTQSPSGSLTMTEEQVVEMYREEHSRAMTPIFEELGPELKVIRNRLNDMTLQRTAPKLKRRKSTKAKVQIEAGPLTLPPDDAHGGKAGKVAYPVLVGEVTNLYKTSKYKPMAAVTIDLHGCSRDEALQKLNESLPVWVDTAMKGEHPWVIPVDIICGGGSQILSDLVKKWIRTKRQVANRPKGLV